ncbi:hypothetical protein BSKO_04326 [Bryopsis sp. KO-2023]|nr:hypothetical protein BSKO_04326 [Bryopsis sp. KO-2023]
MGWEIGMFFQSFQVVLCNCVPYSTSRGGGRRKTIFLPECSCGALRITLKSLEIYHDWHIGDAQPSNEPPTFIVQQRGLLRVPIRDLGTMSDS